MEVSGALSNPGLETEGLLKLVELRRRLVKDQ
jgi:hypothetical protein